MRGDRITISSNSERSIHRVDHLPHDNDQPDWAQCEDDSARPERGSGRPVRIGVAYDMPTRRQRRRVSVGPGIEERANEALTNLSIYALTLDVEYHRLDDRLVELAKTEAEAAQLGSVLRERDEVAAEREAFRGALTALRDHVCG
jgi:hypothetical protein